MTYAPIIVFAYDRPDHLSQTLEALSKNDLARESKLYVYCDGFKETATSEQKTRVFECRRIAHKVNGFKNVQVIEREKNIGLADNIVSAVTEIVNQYGRVIVFEDDIVATKGCLTYLNDALELYKDDELVMHISAYIYPHKEHLPETLFYYTPFPAGGWATWKRAWIHYNSDVADHVRYWQNDWKSFNVLGQDHLQKQLLMNYTGQLKTWYIRWYSSMRRLGGLCLYPGTAMSNNIGFDGTGETSQVSSKYYVQNLLEYVRVSRIPIRCNKKAICMFRHEASGHWYSKRYREKWWRKVKDFFRIFMGQ